MFDDDNARAALARGDGSAKAGIAASDHRDVIHFRIHVLSLHTFVYDCAQSPESVHNRAPGGIVPNYSTKIASIEQRVSAEEWQTRVDLAAFYRLVDLWGMSDLIANHISVRVPGEPHHFLINPYG